MTKKEFMEMELAKKESKKVAIAGTGMNVNYVETSAEYKEFRCSVNKWQKDTRAYLDSVYGLSFAGCFRFEVATGTFKPTTKGKDLKAELDTEVWNELRSEMDALEEEFSTKVLGK